MDRSTASFACCLDLLCGMVTRIRAPIGSPSRRYCIQSSTADGLTTDLAPVSASLAVLTAADLGSCRASCFEQLPPSLALRIPRIPDLEPALAVAPVLQARASRKRKSLHIR